MLHSRYNLNQFEKPKLTETNEGFLKIKGNILKADSFMEYMDKEGVLREKIPKDILFSEETKNSFLHKKVTLEHPEKNGKLTMINSGNVSEFGKGTIIEIFENQDCLGATLQIEDKETVDFIKQRYENGENIELSAGYHVAILSGKGRAGSDVKLIYNYLDYEEEKMKLKFNGKELTPEELLVEAINLQKEGEDFKEKYNALETEKETLAAEKTTLETEKQELTTKYGELETKYNSLLTETENKEIISKAKEVLNSVDEKEAVEKIMEKVIKEVNPKYNAKENSKVEDLKEMFDFGVETLSEMNKETKASEKGKFNESETGLTLKIDNSYFSKKRNGGN